ncbi:MAG: ABC transporter permease [Terriglobales bacterium]
MRISVGVCYLTVLAMTVAALSLAAGFYSAVLRRPLPFGNPGRLYALHTATAEARNLPLAEVEIAALRRSRAVEGLAFYRPGQAVLRSGQAHRQAAGLLVSTDFLSVLGVRATRGRGFLASDADHAVVILNSPLCAEMFGSGECLGRSVETMGKSFEVVGVLDQDFQFGPGAFVSPEMPEFLLPFSLENEASPDDLDLPSVARIADGFDRQDLASQLATLQAQVGRKYALLAKGRLYARPLADEIGGPAADFAFPLFCAVAILSLLAAVSLGGLLTASAAWRRRGLAIRSVLGASTRGLMARPASDLLFLGIAGGAVGYVLAFYLADRLRGRTGLPGAYALTPSWLAAAACAAVATAVAAVLLLAFVRRIRAADCSESFRAIPRMSRHGGRVPLLTLQLSLTLPLLVGLALMASNLMIFLRHNAGFDVRHITSLELHLTGPYNNPHARWQALTRLRRELAAVPGAVGAGIVTTPPGARRLNQTSVRIEMRGVRFEAEGVGYQALGPRALRVLGVRLVQGRWLAADENARGSGVALVNEAFARRYLPGRPIGAQLDLDMGAMPRLRVVGVVSDFQDAALTVPAIPEIFFPAQGTLIPIDTLVVRTTADASLVADELRGVLNRDQPAVAADVAAGDVLLRSDTRRQSMFAWVLASFSIFAFAIAVLGVAGVCAGLYSRAAREMAIRSALGADGANIARLFLARSARAAAPGIVIGLCLGWIFESALRGELLGSSPHMLGPLAGVGLMMLLTVVLVGSPFALRSASDNHARILRAD